METARQEETGRGETTRLLPPKEVPITMGNIGVTEILVIAVVALLLFGAGRIADIGKGLGQGIKNFKQGLKEADEVDRGRAP
jgi:sec-independent protein translocase protein TatA